MNRNFKKILCAALSAAMLPMPIFAASGAESSAFEDIKGHWAKADIEYLFNAGLVSGMSETEFAPDLTIDKAQFVTMLVRSLGLAPDIYSVNFSDVAPLDDWFAGYLGAAVNAGIIENSAHAFAPDGEISRAAAAVMLKNAIEFEGLSEEIPKKEIYYSDVAADSELSAAVQEVSALGVMVGKTEDEFDPEGTLTRAESAAVVKRLSLAASAVGEISLPLNITDAVSVQSQDGVVTMGGDYSSFAIESVDFHYGINQLKVNAAASGADLQLEMWIDSLDTMLGTKLGTVCLEASGANFTEQTANINNTYGNHKVYFRLIGSGSVSLSGISIKANDLNVVPKSYVTKSSGVSRSGNALYNFKRGAYANYAAQKFGNGYNMIELTMSGSSDGQLFEIWIADRKAALVETKKAADGESVLINAPIVSADSSKTISVKAVTDIDGKLENIRFYNETGKADLTLTAEAAETELALADSSDYSEGKETEVIRNGDVIKFSNVNLSNGYNILSARIKNDAYLESSLGLKSDGEVTASVMSIFSGADDDASVEVRLDSENGKLIGTLKENPISGGEIYDTQSCHLSGAEGVHDIYLKAKGDTGWRLEYIKLQERGWYDMDMISLEAEDMTSYLGEIPAADDISRYAPHNVNSEASGKSSVKITQNGGYVEFTIPEGYEAGENRTAITVRHSIPDYIDSANHSVGQEGKMHVLINGENAGLLSSFEDFKENDSLTLSSKYVYGYGSKWGVGNQGYVYKDEYYSNFFFDDAYAVIKGKVKAGDVIRLVPEINDKVNFCYIDLVDIETIPEPKVKPEGYLSITECGAIPNDGLDDGEALRKAVQTVKDDPYNYFGIWIPEGLFDITSYTGDRGATAADFSGIRVLGAGEWYSQLLTHLGSWTQWCANYNIAENTVIRDVALHSGAIARGWATDGVTLGAIGLNGTGATFVENVWFEHWNANIWIADGVGVYAKNRVKNTWADGFNAHDSSKNMQFYKNYLRATGDDALAVFSSCEKKVNLSEDIQIRNNTVIGVYWASGITIWGAKDLDITNNLVADIALHTGIGLNSWGYESPAPENLWIRNNRIERCGNVNEGNQDNGAFGLTPAHAKYTHGTYNNIYKNIFCENNEFIDNPSVFMRISSQNGADDVFLNIRYNYIRNTCLAFPERRRVVDYRTSSVKGKDIFSYNVLEGAYEKFRTSNTSDMTDVLVGNVPDNWN